MNYLLLFLYSLYASLTFAGIGGGGAMGSINMDPKNDKHLFVSSHKGVLYESFNHGKTWQPLKVSSNLVSDKNVQKHQMGFSTQGIIYWSDNNGNLRESLNLGKTWYPLTSLATFFNKSASNTHRKISYWRFSEFQPNHLYIGTNQGLLFSKDLGNTWKEWFSHQKSLETKVIANNKIIHITDKGVFEFDVIQQQLKKLLKAPLKNAAIGIDHRGITLAASTLNTKEEDTYLWIKAAGEEPFIKQKLPVGKFLKMAQNNASIIYFTEKKPNEQTIWRSLDAGHTFELMIKNDEDAIKKGLLKSNPIGNYVGYLDESYHDLQIAPNNALVIATSGKLFFKLSKNGGKNWSYPYLQRDTLTPVRKNTWFHNSQLNPINVYFIKRHPQNKNYLIAGVSDIGCLLTLNNGKTWRLCNIPGQNSIYDLVLNPHSPNELYASTSQWHNFPQSWHADIVNFDSGGIFFSEDYGLNWIRISPASTDFKNPYLSLAINFKQSPCEIYSGTQGKGIVFSADCGKNWKRMNKGFEPLSTSKKSNEKKGSLIFPRIKISPLNGDVYALHAGNRFWEENNNTFLKYTGLYKLDKNKKRWFALGRPKVLNHKSTQLWKYPLTFDIDWKNPDTMYLIDIATLGNSKVTGLWQSINQGKNWNRLLTHDNLRQVKITEDSVFTAGWHNETLEQHAFYQSINKGPFSPVELPLPLLKVSDFIIENNTLSWVSTLGAGSFYINKVLPSKDRQIK